MSTKPKLTVALIAARIEADRAQYVRERESLYRRTRRLCENCRALLTDNKGLRIENHELRQLERRVKAIEDSDGHIEKLMSGAVLDLQKRVKALEELAAFRGAPIEWKHGCPDCGAQPDISHLYHHAANCPRTSTATHGI